MLERSQPCDTNTKAIQIYQNLIDNLNPWDCEHSHQQSIHNASAMPSSRTVDPGHGHNWTCPIMCDFATGSNQTLIQQHATNTCHSEHAIPQELWKYISSEKSQETWWLEQGCWQWQWRFVSSPDDCRSTWQRHPNDPMNKCQIPRNQVVNMMFLQQTTPVTFILVNPNNKRQFNPRYTFLDVLPEATASTHFAAFALGLCLPWMNSTTEDRPTTSNQNTKETQTHNWWSEVGSTKLNFNAIEVLKPEQLLQIMMDDRLPPEPPLRKGSHRVGPQPDDHYLQWPPHPTVGVGLKDHPSFTLCDLSEETDTHRCTTCPILIQQVIYQTTCHIYFYDV